MHRVPPSSVVKFECQLSDGFNYLLRKNRFFFSLYKMHICSTVRLCSVRLIHSGFSIDASIVVVFFRYFFQKKNSLFLLTCVSLLLTFKRREKNPTIAPKQQELVLLKVCGIWLAVYRILDGRIFLNLIVE